MIPADLAAVMRPARQRHCEHLPLDCGARPVENLPVLHPDLPGVSTRG